MKKELSTARMTGLCLGEFARAVLGGLIVTYTLKFFNVTPASGLPLLLPAGMMGLLRGVGVIFDAITDPWVASMSDRSASPKGRRIPFMRWAAVPYALTCLLIFFPPKGDVHWLNIVWVIVLLLAYYMASTLYCVPYMALQQEIVTDTRRRVFFYTLNSLMFVLGSAVIYALPVMVGAFKGSGMAPVWAWRAALGIFAVIGAVCAIVPSFLVKERDYVEGKSCYMPLLQSLKTTLAYKNFAVMTVGYLIMQAGDVAVAILIGVCVAFPIACTNILPPSAFADMAQYDRIKTGQDRAGMFVAARQFVTKLSQAAVTAIVSYTMYLGSTDSYPTQGGVRTTALIAAVCLVFAVVVYTFYNDREVVAFIDDWNAKQKQEKAGQNI